MKKILALIVIGCLSVFIYQAKFKKTKTIPLVGVVQIIEHPALDMTRKGIFDELEANGFRDEINFDWNFESAQNNPSLVTQIIQKFIGQNAKVIVSIPTIPAQAAVQFVKQANVNTPIVFASVTDPVSAKILTSNTIPTLGITGVSNYVSCHRQLEFFKKILPQLKTLGIIYNPGEVNSVALLEETEKVAKDFDIKIISVVASRTSDVNTAAQSLVEKVDAVFINNDNTALAAFDGVVAVCRLANLPVFVSDIDCVEKGALAALGADQYALGRQAGKMVIEILKNPDALVNIPMEYPKTIREEFNKQVAADLKITLPSS